MTVNEALRKSTSRPRMASGKSKAGHEVLAMNTGAGLRIVKSFTDPTIVRRLSLHERAAEDWAPVERDA